jgi:hypothetical protein
VKSAYNLLYKRSSGGTESSSSRSVESFWNRIWSSRVQPKIRNFIWRACRNILPTQTRLFDKQISYTFSCQWCEDEPETSDHVLWHCEFAQRVWATCPVILPARMEIKMSVMDFVSCCLRDLDSTDIVILFYTMWTL